MPRWIPVAKADDLPVGTGKEVFVDNRILALFRLEDGRLCALDGICPHNGGPLAEGTLSGCVVTCPWHGWQFDVTTGQHQLNPRIVQPGFPVRLHEGRIEVELPDESG